MTSDGVRTQAAPLRPGPARSAEGAAPKARSEQVELPLFRVAEIIHVEEFRQPVVDRAVIALLTKGTRVETREGLLTEASRRTVAELSWGAWRARSASGAAAIV